MSVYDDQESEELRNRLGDRYNEDSSLSGEKNINDDISEDESVADGKDVNARRKLRANDEAAEEEEGKSLKESIGSSLSEDEGGNSDSDDNPNLFKNTKISKNRSSKNKKLLIGSGLGAIGLTIAMVFAFGGFINIFKLDHILQNIDVKTFSRFNASFSGRSNSYLKAYMKIRMMDINDEKGEFTGDNLYFKAKKVDTGNPVTDWYSTLRTGKFETDLQDKTGITFTSIATKQSDGSLKFHPGMITMKGDAEIPFQVIDRVGGDTLVAAANGDLAAITKLGKDFDTFFDQEVFPDNKTARKAIKAKVNDNTHFYQVLKRRHVRKDIQNKSGINSWKFFETTSDKLDKKKLAVQQKILQKVLPNNRMGDLIGCILGSAGQCRSNTDPAAPSNQNGSLPNGASPDSVNDPTDPTTKPTQELNTDGSQIDDVIVDKDGKKQNTGKAKLAGDTIAGDLVAKAESAATGEIEDVAVKEAKKKGIDLVEDLLLKETTSFWNPTRVWSWAQKITKIHNNISNGKFSKIVQNARLAQLAAVYTTYAISRDQARSGELGMDEFGELMQTVNDVGQSEAWQNLNSSNITKASAQANEAQTNVSKIDYCRMSKENKIKNKIHFFCDSPKDSRAADLEKTYKDSFVYALISPIAKAVNYIKGNPIFNGVSGILNFFGDFSGKLITFLHLDQLIEQAMQSLSISNVIEKVIGLGMSQVMGFLGATSIFDGTQPGAVNLLAAGSASTVEASTRGSGGVVSTKKTLGYTNKLAAEYAKEQSSQMSNYDRFASLNNSSSLFSAALFNMSDMNLNKSVSNIFGSISSLPNTLMSIFSGQALAAQNNTFDVASWAGVPQYDIPEACQTLDPLDNNYVQNAVKTVDDSPFSVDAQKVLNKIMPTMTIKTARNSPEFWKLVYDSIENAEKQEDIAGAIYNCALFDQRVMGSMGFTSGYTDDNGFGSTSGSTTNAPSVSTGSTSTQIDLTELTKDSVNIPCPANTIDAGNITTTYTKDVPAPPKIKICKLSSIVNATVNSRVAAAFQTLGEEAKTAGHPLTAASSFRPGDSGGGSGTGSNGKAAPGGSMHQLGVAIDFADLGAEKGWEHLPGATCSNRQTSKLGTYVWLNQNAQKLGIRQFSEEAWHWDFLDASSRCGTPA